MPSKKAKEESKSDGAARNAPSASVTRPTRASPSHSSIDAKPSKLPTAIANAASTTSASTSASTPNSTQAQQLPNTESTMVDATLSHSQILQLKEIMQSEVANVTAALQSNISSLQDNFTFIHNRVDHIQTAYEGTRDNLNSPFPTGRDREYKDEDTQNVTKILQRHKLDPVTGDHTTSQTTLRQEALDMDNQIRDLRACQEKPTGLDLSTRSVTNTAYKAADFSISIAKSWQGTKVFDDIQTFQPWHRKGAAFFSAVGLGQITLMDPFSVPKTLEEWKAADLASYRLGEYSIFCNEVASYGDVQTILTRKTSFTRLNAAYLAVINNRKGLRSTVTAVIESTIDFGTMKQCLPTSDELADSGAARQMFFSVFNYFMLNTEATRLARFSNIVHHMTMGEESVKNFADRLTHESDTLNLMSKDTVISDAVILTVFKTQVLVKFEGHPKYELALQILENSDPDYNLAKLVRTWETIYLEDRAKANYPIVNAFNATLSQSKSHRSNKHTRSNTFSSTGSSSRLNASNPGKNKLQLMRDSDGKPVCFQHVKYGECKFGSKCRYSHNVKQRDYTAFTMQEIDDNITDQAFFAGVNAHKSRHRRKPATPIATSSSKKQRPKSARATYQGAIKNYAKREGKSVAFSAEVKAAHTSQQDATSDDDVVDVSTNDDSEGYTSDQTPSSDSDFEKCNMAQKLLTFVESNLGANSDEKISEHLNFARDETTVVESVDCILDSGATVHICGHRRMFVGKLRACKVGVKCADSNNIFANQCGEVILTLDSGNRLWLRNVLYIPSAPMLISIPVLMEVDCIDVLFKGRNGTCTLYDDSGKLLTTINKETDGVNKKLYSLACTVPKHVTSVKGPSRNEQVFNAYHSYAPRSKSLELTHQRYNHVTEYYCKKLQPKSKGKLQWCDACVVGGLPMKQYSKTTKYDRRPATSRRQLLKCDSSPTLDEENKHSFMLTTSVQGAVSPQQCTTSPDQPNTPVVTSTTPETAVHTNATVNVTPQPGELSTVSTPPLDREEEIAGSAICEPSAHLSLTLAPQSEKPTNFGTHMAWDGKTSPIVSARGYKYAFVGICKATRITISLLAPTKSHYPSAMLQWLRKYNNRFGRYPASLVFDQGGENVGTNFVGQLRELGIQVSFASTKGSNQNAMVERKIGVVWLAMLKILAHSSVPFQFWCYAFAYATLVGNHIPHRGLSFRTPIAAASFVPCDNRIFVWGCEAWHVDTARMSHEAKAKRGVLLGIDDDIKGWQILDIESRKVIVSRNAVFNEQRFPFKDHLKPCLIMLKYGTWPKRSREETVTVDNIDPATMDAVATDEFKASPASDESGEKGGDEKIVVLDDSPAADDTNSGVLPPTTPRTPVNQLDTSKIHSPPVGQEISPICDDDDSWSLHPDIPHDMERTINLDSPKLGKQATKRWTKFQSNHYYQSTDPRRLKFYENKLLSDIELAGNPPPSKSVPAQKIPPKPKPAPLTPVPEGVWEGEPAWEVREIKKVRNSKSGDGTKDYYVRWKGKWPDEWLPESKMGGARELIDKFQSDKRPRGRPRKQAKVLNIPPRKTEKGIHKQLRRSSRLNNNTGSETMFKVSTEFPPPPDYELEQHIHFVPTTTSCNKAIADAHDVVDELMEDERFESKPKTRAEMLRGSRAEEFLKAEEKELYELHKNNTFKIVDCPPNRTPIPCRWVYDIKRDINGKIERFKARLVIQGFRQIEGVDFQHTFSAVSQMRTFRLLVSLSVFYNLRITQYDISNAFLHADLDKELYMKFPPGYENDSHKQNQVFLLLKGLYGLKQASRLWSKLLARAFNKAGLSVAITEPGVFHVRDGPFCVINVHVDDYNITTADEQLRTEIEKCMQKVFSVKPLGELKLFLGIVVDKFDDDTREGLKLHQRPYHDRALEKYGLGKATAKKTVAESSVKISVLDGPDLNDSGRPIDPPSWPYMSVGGTLMYSACATRPDIAQRVTQLARFNQNPGTAHVKAQKHVLRYIKSDPGKGVIFTRKKGTKINQIGVDPLSITAFCDSDWAGCLDSRRSTIGYVICIAGGPVSWKSQLKKTLALSSCEAEFMALSEVAREMMWLTRFLDEIGITYRTPIIYSDSESAIYWTQDPVQHQRNKHIELKYYYIRDLVGKKLVKVFKINTLNNVADPLTKPSTVTMTENLVPPLMGERAPILEQ